MNQEKKYFALDLELNNAQDNSTINPKIIQVGIAIGNFLDYKNNLISTYKWYLDPNESIFEFITGLTGISNEDISKYSIPHEQVAKELGELISKHNCFLNPIVWGGGDSTELLSEFKDRKIEFPYFGRRWIDVKTWHILNLLAKNKNPSAGLSSALGAYKLHFLGTPHRADEDALNTLRLFFKLVDQQQKMIGLVSDAKDIY